MKNNSKVCIFLALLAAVLLIFSFPPFNLWHLAWVAFIPLFYILDNSTGREVFLFYFLSGLLFWLYHIWWLTYVTFLGYSLLVVYLASFSGFFGLSLKFLKEKTHHPLLFLAPPLWILFEFIRNYLFTGFPWSLVGYSQWKNTPLIQISSITGVYGVSFLIIMVNAALADAVIGKTRKNLRNAILSVLLIGCLFATGENMMDRSRSEEGLKIIIIQGNIPQNIKWKKRYEEEILKVYTELSTEAVEESQSSLIIWPETAYPGYIQRGSRLFKKLENLILSIETPFLIGALSYRNGKNYNSAFLFSSSGEIEKIYNKLHLVPFGEYIPLKRIFSFLEKMTPEIGDYDKGEEYTVFSIQYSALSDESSKAGKDRRFSVLICFEDLFPDLARRFTRSGANFLVNITNDAHFGDSACPWQHFTHSVFRAVENGVPVVRVANTGVSGFIDPDGRVKEVFRKKGRAIGKRGWMAHQLSFSSGKTFYTRFGDVFAYLNILYLAVLLSVLSRKSLKKYTGACKNHEEVVDKTTSSRNGIS